MRFVANSITEHYEHIGEQRGELRGELRNKIKEGLELLEQYDALLANGVLSKRAYAQLAPPLKGKVEAAEEQLRLLETPRRSQSA